MAPLWRQESWSLATNQDRESFCRQQKDIGARSHQTCVAFVLLSRRLSLPCRNPATCRTPGLSDKPLEKTQIEVLLWFLPGNPPWRCSTPCPLGASVGEVCIQFMGLFPEHQCDHRASFERPEKWSGRPMVAQTQKFRFLCNCCSTTPVPSLNHPKHANCNWSHKLRRQSGGRTSRKNHWWLKGCRGRRMEAQWSPHRSLNGLYWSAKGGTMETEACIEWLGAHGVVWLWPVGRRKLILEMGPYIIIL